MSKNQMRALKYVTRDTMYAVETVVKKGYNARGCREPENPNRKKYPKKVKKPKADVVSLFLTCGINII
jgi:hypothetical protein